MATVLPPPSKRQRREALERTQVQQDATPAAILAGSFKARFVDKDGNQLADTIEVPLADATEKNVSLLLNTLLQREREEFTPYRFRIQLPNSDIVIDNYPSPSEFLEVLRKHGIENPFETTITLSAEPQAVFKVQAVTRMAHRIPGHGQPILAAQFSPKSGSLLATGSGGMDKTLRLFDPSTGQAIGKPFTGHSKWITSMSWQPFHLWRDDNPRIASASKDGTIRLWLTNSGTIEHVRVWNAVDGTLRHKLESHVHWVNSLSLSSDAVLRTGFYDHTKKIPESMDDQRAKAKERFEKAAKHQGKIVERIISASDDCTMYLWDPESHGTKPLARLLGHQKGVNHCVFSPDGNYIASCGFDNQVKVWDRDGKFLATLRGHVAPVFQCSFSADSRLLVTCSRDTTLKIWNMRTFKLQGDLPGHDDEVYAVDWSPDGSVVGSGGKDKAVRIWRN
ncbi:Uu.00g041060.m01.CDS01 [Anthostomella pinea]|uniref:Uu.00g041060.m01.CDS01 n=1 Tax=Anthostomella pinea TaxID=933095 RepID=A0AAI8VAF7_9PEZI|nr:Uu.00g041060.m01.CDS01 [Anthostomella pinea]